MKKKLTKTEYEKLAEEKKADYKAFGDVFILDLEDDDADALVRARDREKQKAKEATDKLEALQREMEDLKAKLDDDATVTAKKKGDIETLEASWKAKLQASEDKYKALVAKREDQLKGILVNNAADNLAREISTAPKLMARVIKDRLSADLEAEIPATRVLGADGKVSASTMEDLKKELLDDKDLAGVLIGSKATGGSAEKPGAGSRGRASGAQVDPQINLATLGGKALVERLQGSLKAKG